MPRRRRRSPRMQFYSFWVVNCRGRGRCYPCSTGQAVLERSDCDSLREGGRRCSGAVLHRTVQQVVDRRIGSFVVQGGIRHTASEEGRIRSCRCQFLPANLKSVGDVEAVGTSGRETAGGLSNGFRLASETAVGLPCSSLDGNRHSEGHDWHSARSRYR